MRMPLHPCPALKRRQALCESSDQPAQPGGGLLTPQNTGSHSEGEVFPSIDIRFFILQEAVLAQENETSDKPDAFVAIHKGTIAAKVKKISCRNLDGIRYLGLSHHRCLRSSYGGFQQITRAQPRTATVRGKHLSMNGNHGINVRMPDAHDRRRKSSLFFWISRRAASATVVASMTAGSMGAIVMAPPEWTSTFTSSPTLSRASCSRAESKMMPCELPILVMVLIMR